MASDTVVLAFDTSGPFCAAAVLINGEFTACRADDMARGQAEAIMDMIVDVLTTSGVTLQDVSRIGVGTGPGNFTGIRISVSAARGFALSLGIPAIGVNGFDATLYRQSDEAIACLPAIRDQIYFSGHGLNAQLGDRDQAAQLGRPLIDRPIQHNWSKISHVSRKTQIDLIAPSQCMSNQQMQRPHAIYPQRC